MALYAIEGRDNNFHIIRHAAAIGVVLSHAYSVTTGLYAEEPLVALTGMSIGHYAVDVFFLLSGFLVTQSLARNTDLLRFALSRLVRIFPALLVTVLLTALVLGPLVSGVPVAAYFSDPATWRYVAGAGSTLHVTGTLPGVFADQPDAGIVNVPLWTLKYELTAYGLLGAMAALSLLRVRWAICIVLAGLAVAYVAGRQVYAWPTSEGFVNNVLHLMPAFFIGSLAYLKRRHIPYGLPLTGLLVLITVAVRDTQAFEIAETLLTASIVFWIAFLPSTLSQSLARHGDVSYGLYVMHFPVLQTIYMVHPEIGAPALFFAGLAVTLPLAMLSWRLVEQPGMRLRAPLETWLRKMPPIARAAARLSRTKPARP